MLSFSLSKDIMLVCACARARVCVCVLSPGSSCMVKDRCVLHRLTRSHQQTQVNTLFQSTCVRHPCHKITSSMGVTVPHVLVRIWACFILYSISYLWHLQFSCHIFPSCDSFWVVNIHSSVNLSPQCSVNFSHHFSHFLISFCPQQFMQVIISVFPSLL